MGITKINWTDRSWSPVTGCSKISDGCKNCYAEVMAKRLQAMGTKGYENGFEVTIHPERLQEPYKWKKPQKIFVCSMSDLFHKEVPFSFINKVMQTMWECLPHTFQLLTKRPEQINSLGFNESYFWSSNIWLGVTVENSKTIGRIDTLKQIPAKTKFISFEPLLSEIPQIDLTGIDWVIVGAESGHNARDFDIEWARDLKRQCDLQNVKFWMKQICKNGRDIGFENYPIDLQVREFPV